MSNFQPRAALGDFSTPSSPWIFRWSSHQGRPSRLNGFRRFKPGKMGNPVGVRRIWVTWTPGLLDATRGYRWDILSGCGRHPMLPIFFNRKGCAPEPPRVREASPGYRSPHPTKPRRGGRSGTVASPIRHKIHAPLPLPKARLAPVSNFRPWGGSAIRKKNPLNAPLFIRFFKTRTIQYSGVNLRQPKKYVPNTSRKSL